MEEVIETLDRAEQLLGRVSVAPIATIDDDLLVAIVARAEAVARRLDAIRLFAAAEIEVRSRRELGDAGLSRRYGYQRASHLIEGVARVSSADATQRIRLGAQVAPRMTLDGRQLEPLFPTVSNALADGRIGMDAGGHIVRALAEASPRGNVDDVAAAERALVSEAENTPADLIRDQARAWRDHLDTDGAEPRCDAQQSKRIFRLGRERDDGMTPFTGLADPVNAGILRAGLNAFRSKVMMTDQRDGGAAPDAGAENSGGLLEGTPPPESGALGEVLEIAETRTSGQRDFDILLGLVEAGIHADGTVRAGGRASVVATVRLDNLLNHTGVGWLDDVRESLSIAAIDELSCDSGIEIAVTGTNGALLALTSRQEFFTAAQRRAMAARDGGCVWNNCHAPASWTDAHHVTERQEGGKTEVSNGVLLCPPHHRMLHSSAFLLRMIRGRPHMRAPPAIDPAQRWRPVGRSRSELVGLIQKSARAHQGDGGAVMAERVIAQAVIAQTVIDGAAA